MSRTVRSAASSTTLALSEATIGFFGLRADQWRSRVAAHLISIVFLLIMYDDMDESRRACAFMMRSTARVSPGPARRRTVGGPAELAGGEDAGRVGEHVRDGDLLDLVAEDVLHDCAGEFEPTRRAYPWSGPRTA